MAEEKEMEEKEEKEKEMEEVGKVLKYFPHPEAAVVEVTAEELKVGDTIHIKGHTSDFQQTIESMQIEASSIQVAKKGDQVGIKVKERVRQHDIVYRVSP